MNGYAWWSLLWPRRRSWSWADTPPPCGPISCRGLSCWRGVIALIAAVIRCDQVGGLSAGLEAITKATEGLHLTAAQAHRALGDGADDLLRDLGTAPQMIHKYYGIRDDREVRRGRSFRRFSPWWWPGEATSSGPSPRLFFTELPSPPAGGAGHPDYLIPNMLDQSGIPTVLIGVVLVLLIAASVSTLSSITITASSTPDHGSDPTPTPHGWTR